MYRLLYTVILIIYIYFFLYLREKIIRAQKNTLQVSQDGKCHERIKDESENESEKFPKEILSLRMGSGKKQLNQR